MSWLKAILDEAAAALPVSAAAVDYLGSRGVDLTQAKTFGLGWLPATYTVPSCTREFAFWQQRSLRERLIFPLYSPLGTPVGLQTRSPDTKNYETFSLPKALLLFGLPQALDAIWTTRSIVLVEGPFDCLALQRVGVENVVACLTGQVPQRVRDFCWRMADRTIALLDTDEAGRDGVAKLTKALPPGSVVAPWYDAHDPDDLVRAGQGQALADRLRGTGVEQVLVEDRRELRLDLAD